ncbi:MAG: Uma2 family endonuclease [Pleurocapsa sp.]
MTAINIATFTDRISDRQLEQLVSDNPETRFETTPTGKLIIMSPTGGESGRRNTKLVFQVELWNVKNNSGVTFDSSTGFKLSNGATRSPDVSWISSSRWQAIPKELQRKFAPIDPDFVIELMSPTDDLTELQQKMIEYMNCGVRLGWLINPDDKQVEIYRNGQDKEVLDNPSSLSGESILPNLVVDLSEIFED